MLMWHNLGMRLDEWMLTNEVGDEVLATRVGYDRTTISRIRRGKRRPSWDLAERLQEVTDGKVTPNDFVAEGAAAWS